MPLYTILSFIMVCMGSSILQEKWLNVLDEQGVVGLTVGVRQQHSQEITIFSLLWLPKDEFLSLSTVKSS